MTHPWRKFSAALLISLGFTVAVQAADVSVQGVSDNLKDAVEGASLTVTANATGTTDASELIAATRADYARIVGKLYENGYFGPSVSIRIDGQEAANLSVLSPTTSIAKIEIRVEPGPKFTFGTARVAPLPANATIPETFATGQTASTTAMREAVETAVTAWQDAGHPKVATTDQSIQANHLAKQVNASFGLAPGPQLTFGTSRVNGESDVRDERIIAISGLRKQDLYTPTEVAGAAKRLRSTGAFSSVVIREANEIGPNNTLDSIIEVVDQKPRRLGFGGEISSSEGAAVSAFWMHRNARGGAERLRFDTEIGGIGSSDGIDLALSGSWTRPATFRRNIAARFEASLERLRESTYDSNQAEVEIGFNRVVSDEFSVDLSFGYRLDETTQSGTTTTYQHLVTTLGATLDKRDSLLDPQSGFYADMTVMPYLGLQQSANGVRLAAEARAYHAFGPRERTVLAARLQFGAIYGSDLGETPPDLLFYSGGGGTVRGHDYQSLGVTSGGITTGGRGFIGFSTEVRQQITDSIGLVGFYDMGFISADGTFESVEEHGGAGIGLRYFTPIGPIRLDIATPISGAGSGISFYIGIGQSF